MCQHACTYTFRAAVADDAVDGAAVLRKVNRHLLPRFLLLTMLCYVVSYSCSSVGHCQLNFIRFE